MSTFDHEKKGKAGVFLIGMAHLLFWLAYLVFWLAYLVFCLVYLVFWLVYFLLGYCKWCFGLHILLNGMGYLVFWSIFIGMAYLMSFVYGMVYLLHEMEHLMFGMNYVVDHKNSRICIYIWSA